MTKTKPKKEFTKEQKLVLYVKKGSYTKFVELVESGVNVNTVYYDDEDKKSLNGINTFITALIYKKYNILDYIVNHKNFDPNFLNNSGKKNKYKVTEPLKLMIEANLDYDYIKYLKNYIIDERYGLSNYLDYRYISANNIYEKDELFFNVFKYLPNIITPNEFINYFNFNFTKKNNPDILFNKMEKLSDIFIETNNKKSLINLKFIIGNMIKNQDLFKDGSNNLLQEENKYNEKFNNLLINYKKLYISYMNDDNISLYNSLKINIDRVYGEHYFKEYFNEKINAYCEYVELKSHFQNNNNNDIINKNKTKKIIKI